MVCCLGAPCWSNVFNEVFVEQWLNEATGHQCFHQDKNLIFMSKLISVSCWWHVCRAVAAVSSSILNRMKQKIRRLVHFC